MRREVGSMEEVSPGVWRLRVSVGHSTVTGKRRRPSKIQYAATEREAGMASRQAAARGGAAARRGRNRAPVPRRHVPTARRGPAQGRGPWTATAPKSRSTSSRSSATRRSPTSPPTLLDRWLDGVKGSERNRLHVYRVLNAALNVAVRWRLLDNNPLRAVEIPTVRASRKPDVLTLNEAAKYLEAFQGHALEPIIVLALAAGLRRSELAGLRWSDLRFWKETDDDGVVSEHGEVSIVRGLHDRKGEVRRGAAQVGDLDARCCAAGLGRCQPQAAARARSAGRRRTARPCRPGASRWSTAAG